MSEPIYFREDYRIGIEVLRVRRDDGVTWEGWHWGPEMPRGDLPLPERHDLRNEYARLLCRGDEHQSAVKLSLLAAYDMETA